MKPDAPTRTRAERLSAARQILADHGDALRCLGGSGPGCVAVAAQAVTQARRALTEARARGGGAWTLICLTETLREAGAARACAVSAARQAQRRAARIEAGRAALRTFLSSERGQGAQARLARFTVIHPDFRTSLDLGAYRAACRSVGA